MIGIAGAVFFFGYWLLAYGKSQVGNCNAGFVTLVVPGRWSGDCQAGVPQLPNGAGAAPEGTGNNEIGGSSSNPNAPSGANASGPGVRPGAVVPT